MDCRGRAERAFAPVCSDGLFPRYQGKTCDGTSQSGRFIVNLGGTAEVFKAFVPKNSHHLGSLRDEGFFLFPQKPGKKGALTMAAEKIPYKIYLSEEELPRTWYNVRADKN